MKYKLAIFDMDGTILNTLDDLADSLNAVLKKYGFPQHETQAVKYFVGNGIPKLIERAIPEGKNNPCYEEVLKDYISYYQSHSAIKTAPYENMTELLKKLKKDGMLLAVNTNKVETAAKKLCEDYFPGIFDFVSGGKAGVPPKPAPDGVLEILKNLAEVKKEEIVYIGDSDVDIQTGKNAGFDAIGVEWGFRGRDFLQEHGAEKIAATIEELSQFLTIG